MWDILFPCIVTSPLQGGGGGVVDHERTPMVLPSLMST